MVTTSGAAGLGVSETRVAAMITEATEGLGGGGGPETPAGPASFLPDHGEGRTGYYDPRACIYNQRGPNTRAIRTAVARARGRIGQCRILFVGDSGTAGFGVVEGQQDPVTVFRDMIWKGCQVPFGEWAPAYNNGDVDTRWVFDGFPVSGDLALPFRVGSTGNKATYTSTIASNVVEFVTSSASPRFTYKIDGGSAQTIPAAPSPLPGDDGSIQLVRVEGLSWANHVLEITATADGCALVGAGVAVPDGFNVYNSGITSSETAHWDRDLFWQGLRVQLALEPDVVVVELGANDILHDTETGLKARLKSIGERVLDSGAALAYCLTYRPVADASWDPLIAAAYDCADELDVPLLDFVDRCGSLADLEALDLLGPDDLHLNTTGYSMKAIAWGDLLGIPLGGR